jgi:hypothetical protein
MHPALARFSPQAVATATAVVYDRPHARFHGYVDRNGSDILGNLLLTDFPEVYAKHAADSNIPGLPNAMIVADALTGFRGDALSPAQDAEWSRVFDQLVALVKLNDTGQLKTRAQVQALLED